MTAHKDPAGVSYERRDVSPAAVVRAGLVVVGVTALTSVLLLVLFHFLLGAEARRDPSPRPLQPPADRRPPEPRLQEVPFDDLRALRRDEERLLTRYGFVDRQAGLVHVPIEDAMRLFVERGAPASFPGAVASPGPPAAAAVPR